MKKFWLATLILFATETTCFSNSPWELRINLIGNDTIVFNKLVIGFHPEATNNLDTSLGEMDLPPFIPPSGFKLYGVLIFYDSVQMSNIWSYVDLRPFPANSGDTTTFLLYAIKESGVKLRISWRYIADEVRYAFLQDEYLGTLVQVDMTKTTYIDITNEFLDKFYIKIVLPDVNSVQLVNEDGNIYFDGGSKELVFISYFPAKCELINILGYKVMTHNFEYTGKVNASFLTKGLYFAKLTYANGKSEIRKVYVY